MEIINNFIKKNLITSDYHKPCKVIFTKVWINLHFKSKLFIPKKIMYFSFTRKKVKLRWTNIIIEFND